MGVTLPPSVAVDAPTVAPPVAATGISARVHGTCGESSPQRRSSPLSVATESVIRSVHTPAAVRPSNDDSGTAGLTRPVTGAEAVLGSATASSSKIAPTMSSPLKFASPKLSVIRTVTPSWIRWMSRSPSQLCRRSSMRRSTSVIAPPDGTEKVACVVAGTPVASASATTAPDAGRGSTRAFATTPPSVEVTLIASVLVAAHEPAGIRATSASLLIARRPKPSSGHAAEPSSIVSGAPLDVIVPETPGRSATPMPSIDWSTKKRSPGSISPSLSPSGYGSRNVTVRARSPLGASNASVAATASALGVVAEAPMPRARNTDQTSS